MHAIKFFNWNWIIGIGHASKYKDYSVINIFLKQAKKEAVTQYREIAAAQCL